jgi:hypothetical protein
LHGTSSGTWTFNLGLYQGPVTVQTSETDTYFAYPAKTVQVAAGPNSETLTLTAKNQPAEFPWYLVGIVTAVVVAIVAIVLYERRRRRQ